LMFQASASLTLRGGRGWAARIRAAIDAIRSAGINLNSAVH
jgi:hypothetical protein